MATQALSNLAALQQLFAPTAQAIGGLNGAQLAIAQEQYNRAKQLENLQREQAFVRERDTTATNRAIQLANLAGERDDKRLKANEDKQLAQELSRLKAAIRAAFSEYRVKYGGTKKLEELGDINADNLAALSDLAAALTDEMGEAQVANDIAGVESLRAGRLQALERVQAELAITQAEDEEATIQAAQAITDEDDREKFFKFLSGKTKMKPDEIIPRLSAKAAQEVQLAKRSKLGAMRDAKLKGEGYKSALNGVREFDSQIAKLVSGNPRVRDVFAKKPLESPPKSGMAPGPAEGAKALGLGGTGGGGDFGSDVRKLLGFPAERVEPSAQAGVPAAPKQDQLLSSLIQSTRAQPGAFVAPGVSATPQGAQVPQFSLPPSRAAQSATSAPPLNFRFAPTFDQAGNTRDANPDSLRNLVGEGARRRLGQLTQPGMTPTRAKLLNLLIEQAEATGQPIPPEVLNQLEAPDFVPQIQRQQQIFPNIARPTYPLNPGP